MELKGFQGLRSLDNLITEAQVPRAQIAQEQVKEQIEKLPVEYLVAGKYQPRIHFDKAALTELAESIIAQGIIQPLIVRKVTSNQYEIIAGERRWRAAQQAGLASVPVIVREVADNVAAAFALIENIQRENLNPIEEAVAFERFKNEFAMTHEQIAQRVGRSRVSITNTMRLLTLTDSVKQLLVEGKIEMGHARALLTLSSEQQQTVARMIVDQQLNVRQAEQLANKNKLPQLKINQRSEEVSALQIQCDAWARELSNKFSTQVAVQLNAKGSGKIVIQINSPEEVEWLVGRVNVE